MLEVTFKFPDFEAKLRRRAEEMNLFLVANIQTNRGLLFDSEGARYGHRKWAPLKFRAGQILSKRGALRRSIAPANPSGKAGSDGIVRFVGDQIIVGTNLLYARMMNDGTAKLPGGVLRAKNGGVLMIPIPSGKAATPAAKSLKKTRVTYEAAPGVEKNRNVIFRKSVKIPARNFTDWNDNDQSEIDGAFLTKLIEIMND